MSNSADHLLRFAKERFTELSNAEEQVLTKLCQKIAAGRLANYSDNQNYENDPANALNWPAERTIPVDWLIWLFTNRQAIELIPQTGVWVKGARIVGKLELNFRKIPFPISLANCAVEDIELSHAEICTLGLEGTYTRSITANRLKADGVFMRNGFRAYGEVHLISAEISGVLDCSGGSFINPNNYAISADGMTVGSAVFMSDGFRAYGEVRLLLATIGANFECDYGKFYNKGKKAFNAGGINVKGNLHLGEGFKANGEIDLIGAKINQSLNFKKGVFVNHDKDAISADRSQVGGSVFMEGIRAKGSVRFMGATIGSNVGFDSGVIRNEGKTALNAEAIEIKGSLLLRNTKVEGGVKILSARVDGNVECSGCHLKNQNGIALDAERIKIGGNIFFHKDFKCEGDVKLIGAVVGQYFLWSGIKSQETVSLNLQHAKVGAIMDELKSWPENGKLLLDGFVYDNIYHKSPISAKERLEWLHRQPRQHYFPQPYEQLAQTLRRAGHEEAAVEVLIEKNRDETRRLRKYSLSWLWHHLFNWFAGYGYRPRRAFAWSLGFILLGAILFHFGHEHGLITPTNEEAYEPKGSVNISVNYPVFNSFIYSMENFVPLIKLQVADSYAPNANLGEMHSLPSFHCISPFTLTNGSLLRIYLWLHTIAGWFLTTLWVGGLTGLIRR